MKSTRKFSDAPVSKRNQAGPIVTKWKEPGEKTPVRKRYILRRVVIKKRYGSPF